MKPPRRTCTCGSSKFKTDVTIQLYGMPVWFSKNGSLRYNDTKAASSAGWDTVTQPEILCAKCGRRWVAVPYFEKGYQAKTFHLVEG